MSTTTPHEPSTASRRPFQARARILATVDRLFYDEGIHSVGIHRIIEEAGVTRVTLYRHFPSKDDLIAGYLAGRAEHDHRQIDAVIAAHRDDPRRALTELATALTSDDFAAVRRGCPFVNACAEFDASHPTREYALEIRRWVTHRLEDLLTQVGHRSPRAAAAQLMMLRTGAVVSGALDRNQHLNRDFLSGWEAVIDDGRPGASAVVAAGGGQATHPSDAAAADVLG